MHFAKKYWISAIIIFLFTTILSQSSHNPQTVEFSLIINRDSFVVRVVENQNTLVQSVSLRDLGFSYQYNGQPANTKLSEYGGFETDINWAQPGLCIEIHLPDNITPLPNECLNQSVSIPINPADRFWYDADMSVFRPITFDNIFTDQECVIRNFECRLQFEQNAEQADSGEIARQDGSNTESILVSTLAFDEEEQNTRLVLELNGKSTTISQSDCDLVSRSENLPDNQITVFAECDDSATNAEFFVHNPRGVPIEWIIWRVLPQHSPTTASETATPDPNFDPDRTATPDPNFDPDAIIGNVSVVQSNVRSGPGTDFPPDARIPSVDQEASIEITGQYVDLETHQLWYQGIVEGVEDRTVWIFANNVTISAGNIVDIPSIAFDTPPEPPQLPDEDNDGVPDIEDVCPNNPDASRRSECDDGPSASGIANNNRVSNPPTPTPRPPTSTLTPTITNTVTITFTPSPSHTATITLIPSPSYTPTITNTPTPTTPPPPPPPPVITDCTLTVTAGAGVNVRTYPEYGSTVGGGLVNGTQEVISRQMTGAPSGTWYRVATGWVVGSAVSLSGNCAFSTEIYVPQAVTATYTPTNTPGVPPPPPPPPIPGCIAPEITSASAGPVNNGTLPFNPTVNFSLCLNSGQEVWVIVHPITDSNYGWGPTGGSGSMGVNLGTGAGSQCGDSFELRVVIATIGSIQNSTAYGTVPGVVASRTIGTYTKSCT